MKFKIRFADQIVGLVIILALASVAIVIVMLGQAQGWFRNKNFKTVLETAGGLSKNMSVLYKGFTIGNVRDFQLTPDDKVEVTFTIHGDYIQLAREGSIMELQVGFISLLGSQFIFHPGKDDQIALERNVTIPTAGTREAEILIGMGITTYSPSEDPIGNIVKLLDATFTELNPLLADLGEALGTGTGETEIGRIMGSLNKTLASVDDIPKILDDTIAGVLTQVLDELNPIIASITDKLDEPGGVLALVDRDGELYDGLVNSLNAVSGIISGIDKTVSETAAFLPGQFPQIAGLLAELRGTLRGVDDILEGLANNPLLRGGITDRPAESQAVGPRNIRF